MKKYKIYFRINEYLMINDYEEIKGDLDSRVIAGKDEDDAISRLRKSLERYMKGTETRTYDLEIGSVGNNNHNDRSEHAYTERMVHGRAGEKISGSVRQMVRQ